MRFPIVSRRWLLLPFVVIAACSLKNGARTDATAPSPSGPTAEPSARLGATDPFDAAHDASTDAPVGATVAVATSSAPGPAAPPPDTSPLHKTSSEDLLGLFAIKPLTAEERAKILPDRFLASVIGTGSPGKIHQGNPTIAQHDITRAACLRGLEGVTLQTAEQKKACGGENMVPVHLRGKDPYFCIDVFEFPNRPCELPFVWASPTYAKKICELQGKRLCSQIEWQLACRGDPNDGPDTTYAYGDTLDLDACHTKKRHRQVAEKPCTTTDAQTTYRTCSTDTEPAGAYPKCRSRYGVYDLHGNVAEIMMRRDADGTVKSQLKGSAWFYDEVAREPGGPPLHAGSQGAYPDHCNFDPRWHVESIDNAWHVNYHLGFRCCKSIP